MIAPRVRPLAASMAALGAGVIGGLSMWGYHERLTFPLWLSLEVLIIPAVALCLAVLLFRVFSRQGRFWLAVLAFPALMTAYEYLISLHFGTFGATGYTQMMNLPVLQLGAATGLRGIGFVVFLFPSTLAGIILSGAKARVRRTMIFSAIFGLVIAWGVFRLQTTPVPAHNVVVGLVASDLKKNTFPEKDQDALRLMGDYAEQVKLLSQNGAKIVVLPEMTALVRDSVSGQVDDLFKETAKAMGTQIVLGVLHVASRAAFNEARLYSESGKLAAVYRKQHLVPVLEGRTTPAHGISVVHEPIGTVGLEICRDMDYSDPARRYGFAQAGLVLVPAWDFDVDRLWHGHMAIMRGLENGFTVVRVAKRGLLTVSDNRGRVLSEKRTTPMDSFTSMIVNVPVFHQPTRYQSWGDWFARLDLALLAGLLIMTIPPKERTTGPAGGDRDEQLSLTAKL